MLPAPIGEALTGGWTPEAVEAPLFALGEDTADREGGENGVEGF